jgi:5-methylcytosine-specific restriction protein A
MPEWEWTRYPRTFTTISQDRFDKLWEVLLAFQGELSTTEVPKPYREMLREGRARRALAVSYERNARARLLCIQHHGTSCSVCGFNFGSVYGDAFNGFIVVHHLEPLSNKKGQYVVDPVRDMRPVCANCHLIIHKRADPYTIEEVTQMLPEGWFNDADDDEVDDDLAEGDPK